MMGFALPLQAQEPTLEAGQQEEPESPVIDFERVAEGTEPLGGSFDLCLKDDKLYLAVELDQLGRDSLIDCRIAQGIGRAASTRDEHDVLRDGPPGDREEGEALYLLKKPHWFGAEEDGRVRQAVELTIGSSVVRRASIEVMRLDSALVSDATDLVRG